MGCTARYAEAWEFASFTCVSSLLRRTDNGVGAGRAALTDSQTDFPAAGIEANVGMVLYNLTDGSSGPVTAVTEHTLTATLTGGTGNLWDNGDIYRIVAIDAQEIAQIENVLDLVAGDLFGVLAATGACECTLSAYGKKLLKKLNIIEAMAFYACQCGKPSLTDDMRQNLLEWATAQLELIRVGKLELCKGETGSDYPSIGIAQQSINEFVAARIIDNDDT